MQYKTFEELKHKIYKALPDRDVATLCEIIDSLERISKRSKDQNIDHLLSFAKSLPMFLYFEVAKTFEPPSYILSDDTRVLNEEENREADSQNCDALASALRGQPPWRELKTCQNKSTQKKRGMFFWFKQADIDQPQDILIHSIWGTKPARVNGIAIAYDWPKVRFAIAELASRTNDGRYCVGYLEIEKIINVSRDVDLLAPWRRPWKTTLTNQSCGSGTQT
jgi:hypothetical protein